jgi:mRNA-degrading endonuclease toxin of MazEF toxin-antitoxin module
VWVEFDPTVGCEIQKCRPAIVVSADEQNRNDLNAIVIVVPLTKAPVSRSPRSDETLVHPEDTGLRELSITATNQVRAIDRRRIRGHVGTVSAPAMSAVENCLQRALALA